jgi:hypothetical protein
MKKIVLSILLILVIKHAYSQKCDNQDFTGPNQ